MTSASTETAPAFPFRVMLTPYRSLSPRGFLVLMGAIGLVSFVAGAVFWAMGAWPVFGFFGLDALLVFFAFKLNYRSGKLRELIELTPNVLTLTRVHASGARESFDFNPYWVRVRLTEWRDGRTDLRLADQGGEFAFGRFLTDEERREVADALGRALLASRGAVAF